MDEETPEQNIQGGICEGVAMRVWHNWTEQEKALFERVHRNDKNFVAEMSGEELSEIKAIVDINLFQRPLTMVEIQRANGLIDAVIGGVIPAAWR